MRARSHLLLTVLLLALALTLPGGCGGSDSDAPAPPPAKPVSGNPWAQAGPTRLRFHDASAGSGIRSVNHSGRAGVKEFLIEAVGPGASWLDYDGDGLIDLYLPDGDVFPNYDLTQAQDPATGRTRAVLQPKEPRDPVFRDQLWHNDGDGTFTDVAPQAGIVEERWSFGSTAFDLEGDGDLDIYVCNFGPNVLWRNNGDGTFTDVAAELGVQGPSWNWSTAAAVGDLDGDGRLDLYVAAYYDAAAEVDRMRNKLGLPLGTPIDKIGGRDCRWRGIPAYCGPIGLKGQHDTCYRQKEDGTFEDVTDAWGLRPRVGLYAFTCLMFDFNADGLQDVYVANDSEENFMWQQERDAEGRVHFRDTSDVLGIKVGSQVAAQASMGMVPADINADGQLDIFVTNFSHDYNNMYIAQRAGAGGSIYFKDRGMHTMGQQVYYDLSWGCGWYDFDNDGDLDLYVANGHVYKEIDLLEKTGAQFDQLNALFETMDAERLGFREVGPKAQRTAAADVDKQDLYAGDGMEVEQCSRQAAFGDYDNDGRVDVLVLNMNTEPTLLHNESPAGPDASWVKLSLRQPGGNREALGAFVEVRGGPRPLKMGVVRQRSFLGCDDPRLNVGLAGAATCDVVVTWPGRERATTEFKGLAAGAHWLLDRATGKAERLPLPTVAK